MKDPQQSSQSSSSSQSQLLPPSPLPIDYWACQYSSWYPTFSRPFPGRKRGLTIPSYIIHWPPPSRSPNDDNNNDDNVDNNVDNVLIRYLKEDGIQLPPSTQPSSCLSCQPRRHPSSTSSSSDDDDSDEEDHDWDSHDNIENKVDQVSNRPHYYYHGLNSLIQEITLAIQQLGGCVIPKLNWSTPKDAIWINEGTLKCTTAGDVYLLFKSSDFIASDVQLLESLLLQQQEGQEQEQKEDDTTTNDNKINDSSNNNNKNGIQIVLRKYANLYPSSEFRCFVKNHCLVAISQRHDDLYFEHLQIMKQEYEEQTTRRKQSDHQDIVFQEQQDHDNHDQESSSSSSSHTVCCWIHVIQEVMTDWIIPNFAHGQVSNFVVDVYMDQQNRLWILDFNVWGIRTDSLLFDWNELQQQEQQQQQFGNKNNKNGNDKNKNNDDNENCINNNNTKQQDVEFRVVQTEKEVRSHRLNNFRVPIDTMHIASITGGNMNGGFEAFMNLCQKQQQEEEDDEEEDEDDDDRKASTKEKKEDEEKDDEVLS